MVALYYVHRSQEIAKRQRSGKVKLETNPAYKEVELSQKEMKMGDNPAYVQGGHESLVPPTIQWKQDENYDYVDIL